MINIVISYLGILAFFRVLRYMLYLFDLADYFDIIAVSIGLFFFFMFRALFFFSSKKYSVEDILMNAERQDRIRRSSKWNFYIIKLGYIVNGKSWRYYDRKLSELFMVYQILLTCFQRYTILSCVLEISKLYWLRFEQKTYDLMEAIPPIWKIKKLFQVYRLDPFTETEYAIIKEWFLFFYDETNAVELALYKKLSGTEYIAVEREYYLWYIDCAWSVWYIEYDLYIRMYPQVDFSKFYKKFSHVVFHYSIIILLFVPVCTSFIEKWHISFLYCKAYLIEPIIKKIILNVKFPEVCMIERYNKIFDDGYPKYKHTTWPLFRRIEEDSLVEFFLRFDWYPMNEFIVVYADESTNSELYDWKVFGEFGNGMFLIAEPFLSVEYVLKFIKRRRIAFRSYVYKLRSLIALQGDEQFRIATGVGEYSYNINFVLLFLIVYFWIIVIGIFFLLNRRLQRRVSWYKVFVLGTAVHLVLMVMFCITWLPTVFYGFRLSKVFYVFTVIKVYVIYYFSNFYIFLKLLGL